MAISHFLGINSPTGTQTNTELGYNFTPDTVKKKYELGYTVTPGTPKRLGLGYTMETGSHI